MVGWTHHTTGVQMIRGSDHSLPTYLPQPNAFKPHTTLKEHLEHERTPTGWWHNFPKYAVSLFEGVVRPETAVTACGRRATNSTCCSVTDNSRCGR